MDSTEIKITVAELVHTQMVYLVVGIAIGAVVGGFAGVLMTLAR